MLDPIVVAWVASMMLGYFVAHALVGYHFRVTDRLSLTEAIVYDTYHWTVWMFWVTAVSFCFVVSLYFSNK